MLHELKLAHEELEMRVSGRTAELAEKNLQIQEQAKTLEMTNRDLRELTARLLQVQDDERRRIARDLHDSTGQILALLSMTLSGLQSEAKKFSTGLADGLGENVEIVRQVSAELRTLSYLLHPPLLDEMGLESALRWYVDGFGKRSGIKVTLDLPSKLGTVVAGVGDRHLQDRAGVSNRISTATQESPDSYHLPISIAGPDCFGGQRRGEGHRPGKAVQDHVDRLARC